jgi:uncharacterized NAD(P)/FAD-binding protein YdhS
MRVGIIGNGFCGTMLCHHLVKLGQSDLEISVFEKENDPGKGIAYSPQSTKVLLNVIASKMSAFPDDLGHFVEWLCTEDEYKYENRQLIANSFIPRSKYGKYLSNIWNETNNLAQKKGILIQFYKEEIIDLTINNDSISIYSTQKDKLNFDKIILATGNQLPRNPSANQIELIKSPRYFQNPWNFQTNLIDSKKPVFILGNGLTMVDTVMQIREQKIENTIVAVSPHGFNILPHRNFNFDSIFPKINSNASLIDIVNFVNRELKILEKFGISAEPLIDYLRPYTQQLWQNFTYKEKRFFMQNLRHLWGVARHRIPFITYDIIQKERIDNRLKIVSGKITQITTQSDSISVSFLEKMSQKETHLDCSIFINCTGPESDIQKTNSNLLKSCLNKGYIDQDFLKLGINTDVSSFKTINKSKLRNKNLYTLGSSLRGELWESTAVNELRQQAKNLAIEITQNP